MKKTAILIGGGKSVREGLDKNLWEKIAHKEVWSLNYAFMTMPYLPKRELFVDRGFYKNNRNELLTLIDKGVELVSRYQPHYAHEAKFTMYQTTKEKTGYKGKQALKTDGTPHLFVGQMGLVGMFGLSLAIAENYAMMTFLMQNSVKIMLAVGALSMIIVFGKIGFDSGYNGGQDI